MSNPIIGPHQHIATKENKTYREYNFLLRHKDKWYQFTENHLYPIVQFGNRSIDIDLPEASSSTKMDIKDLQQEEMCNVCNGKWNKDNQHHIIQCLQLSGIYLQSLEENTSAWTECPNACDQALIFYPGTEAVKAHHILFECAKSETRDLFLSIFIQVKNNFQL